MRKVYHQQGSEDWLRWRKGLLTATDAATLAGVNPYCSPHLLWQRKLGLAPEQVVTSAMRRGTRDEDPARQLFIKDYGIKMTPCCIESDLYNFLGASLDGISDCGQYIIEVKSQAPEAIQALGIPVYHMYQMQHQMLCGDGTIKKCFYITHWIGKNYYLEVLPNPDWVEDYIPFAKEYWKKVIFQEAPPMTTGDYKDKSTNTTWNALAHEYKLLDEQSKSIDLAKESIRKQLIEQCEEESCMGSGIKIAKRHKKGSIDYDSIPALATMDLEPYRKAPSTSWTITIDKK